MGANPSSSKGTKMKKQDCILKIGTYIDTPFGMFKVEKISTAGLMDGAFDVSLRGSNITFTMLVDNSND